MVFSLKRGRPSSISSHGSLELTHWWNVGRTRAADRNGQQVPVAYVEADAAPARRADHALTETLPGLGDESAAE
jgi:hypothetical protein